MHNRYQAALTLALALFFLIWFTPAGLAMVAAPTNLTAALASMTSVTLTWQDNAGNENEYWVYRRDPGTTMWNGIATLPADTVTYTDTGLVSDFTYTYYVMAAYDDGNNVETSMASNEISITPPGTGTLPPGTTPAAPTFFNAVSLSNSAIYLNWFDNASNEDSYRLDRLDPGSGDWLTIATLAADISNYTDSGLAPSSVYKYRISACNEVGCATCLTTAEATTEASSTLPDAPSNLVAALGPGNTINLNWSDNSNDEQGFILDSFVVGDIAWHTLATLGVDFNYYNLVNAASGTYQFTVYAFNSQGNSAPTNIVEVTVPDSSPEPGPATTESIVMKFFAGSNQYTVDGIFHTMDAAPIDQWNRLFLPIRYVVQPLGMVPQWDGVSKVTIQNSTTTIELWLDDNVASVNSAPVFIDPDNTDVVPFSIPPGRVMLPLRFVTENLGCIADWDPTPPGIATITYPKVQ